MEEVSQNWETHICEESERSLLCAASSFSSRHPNSFWESEKSNFALSMSRPELERSKLSLIYAGFLQITGNTKKNHWHHTMIEHNSGRGSEGGFFLHILPSTNTKVCSVCFPLPGFVHVGILLYGDETFIIISCGEDLWADYQVTVKPCGSTYTQEMSGN